MQRGEIERNLKETQDLQVALMFSTFLFIEYRLASFC